MKKTTQQSTEYLFRKALVRSFPFLEEQDIEIAYKKAIRSVNAEKKSVGDFPVNNPSQLINKGTDFINSIITIPDETDEDFLILQAIEENDQKNISRFYKKMFNYFMGFAHNKFHPLSKEVKIDVYQDSWIVIIEYIQSRKIRIINIEGEIFILGLRKNASIRTLLIAIGKRLLIKASRFPKNYLNPVDYNDDLDNQLQNDLPSVEEAESKFLLLERAFKQLPQKYKRLLLYDYWMNMSRKEIMSIMDISSSSAVGVDKFRALKKLREIYFEMANDE